VDTGEARRELGTCAFGVRDEGQVAVDELACLHFSWGRFGSGDAREDSARGGFGPADKDDVRAAVGVPSEGLCDALPDAGGAADEDTDGVIGRPRRRWRP
jgi:hypothetical protein